MHESGQAAYMNGNANGMNGNAYGYSQSANGSQVNGHGGYDNRRNAPMDNRGYPPSYGDNRGAAGGRGGFSAGNDSRWANNGTNQFAGGANNSNYGAQPAGRYDGPPQTDFDHGISAQELMSKYEENAQTWGNSMPALTGKEIGGDETDLTEARVWGSGQIAEPFTSFNSCAFPKQIMASIFNLGFAAPTPIQAYCWPVAGEGRDLIGIAKTGSGKTLAFLLPPFAMFLGQRPQRGPSMLVMAPTRELANQIQQEAEKFGRKVGVSSVCVYGGASRGPQLRELRQGRHLVVGTPGRLNDFLEANQMHLDLCTHLVLDEADRMLDMGFEPQIRTLIQAIPPQRQTMMFSATWPREVRKLAADYMREPVHVQIGSHEATANKDITQEVCVVSGQREKQERLREILSKMEPTDKVIVFSNTKRMCEQLAQDMRANRISCATIHGDREQRERDQALHAFKTGRSPILAATDVAARGLDIKGVKLVVCFDAAANAEDHIHRIGRTGRAGMPGHAITFLDYTEGKQAREVMQTMEKVGQPVPQELRDLARNSRGKGNSRKGGGKGKGGGFNRFGGGGGGKGRGGGAFGGGGCIGCGGFGGKGGGCTGGGCSGGFGGNFAGGCGGNFGGGFGGV